MNNMKDLSSHSPTRMTPKTSKPTERPSGATPVGLGREGDWTSGVLAQRRVTRGSGAARKQEAGQFANTGRGVSVSYGVVGGDVL